MPDCQDQLPASWQADYQMDCRREQSNEFGVDVGICLPFDPVQGVVDNPFAACSEVLHDCMDKVGLTQVDPFLISSVQEEVKTPGVVDYRRPSFISPESGRARLVLRSSFRSIVAMSSRSSYDTPLKEQIIPWDLLSKVLPRRAPSNTSTAETVRDSRRPTPSRPPQQALSLADSSQQSITITCRPTRRDRLVTTCARAGSPSPCSPAMVVENARRAHRRRRGSTSPTPGWCSGSDMANRFDDPNGPSPPARPAHWLNFSLSVFVTSSHSL